MCDVLRLAVRLAGIGLAGYFTAVTVGERIVASPVEFSAQIRQAEVFYSSLAQLRAEVCDQLDEQARKLAHYERVHDAEGVLRQHRRITAIGAEIREIDRMMHALGVRLTDRKRVRAAR